jgi:PAS domain S-box-containing protein
VREFFGRIGTKHGKRFRTIKGCLSCMVLFMPLISIQSLEDKLTTRNPGMVLPAGIKVATVPAGYLFLTLAMAVIIICALFIYYSARLRKAGMELTESKRHLNDANTDLEQANMDLEQSKQVTENQPGETDKIYEMLFNSAAVSIFFHDLQGKLKYANPAFYSLIGIDRETYESTPQSDIIHPEDTGYEKKKTEALARDGFFESELRLRHKSGHFINLSTKSVNVKNDSGEIIGSLTVSSDVTRLKQHYEENIKETAAIEASNRLKSRFFANISHEIRTPLNSVVGFSNLLMDKDISDKDRETYIEQINYNSEKLLQVIGDIIDLSRLESSQIEITYEEASLSAVIREVVEEARQAIRRNDKPIILNVREHFDSPGDLIFTDSVWLKRVLNHILDNAVKFTLDGSIEFFYGLDNDHIVFRIKDTGIGINKENLGRIFEEFRQEHIGHHRLFDGLGIGLSLAKEVIERMGGKIFVSSEKGMGSEFSFYIPYRPAGRAKPKFRLHQDSESYELINWSTRKCLLVDDNKDVVTYLNRLLLDTGIGVISARSCHEALEILRNRKDIDVVLLDMQMPEMNGIEVAREIRKINKTLPVIAQTAYIFEEDKDIIIEAGCDACLIKPIRKDQLLTIMSSLFRNN